MFIGSAKVRSITNYQQSMKTMIDSLAELVLVFRFFHEHKYWFFSKLYKCSDRNPCKQLMLASIWKSKYQTHKNKARQHFCLTILEAVGLVAEK